MNASNSSMVRRTIASALGACLVGLVCFVPLTTVADDANDGLALGFEIAQDQATAGPVEATAKLIRDERDMAKWFLEARFQNRDMDEQQTAQFDERIERTVYQPMMARSGPMPTVAWTFKERVVLEPGAVSVVRHPLPKALCAQLARYARAQEQADKGKAVAGPMTSFSTSLVAHEDAAPDPAPVVQRARFAKGRSAKLSLVEQGNLTRF
jgi:hypothetical protein